MKLSYQVYNRKCSRFASGLIRIMCVKQSGNMSRHKFKTKQIKCPKKGDLKKTHAPLAKNGT